MRLPGLSRHRRSVGEGGALRVELGGSAASLVEYYMAAEGLEDPSEAVARLVEKGYHYWQLEQRSEDREPRGAWDSTEWTMRVAAGYAYYRLRLRDAVEELRRLTMTLGGVLGDLRLCYEHPEKLRRDPAFAERIERYKRELRAYIDEFITALRRDIDSGDRYARDEEVIEALEALLERYKRAHGKGGAGERG